MAQPAPPLPPELRELRCEICGSTEDLRNAWLMTGEPKGSTKRPICGLCYLTWYDTGEVTREGILRARGLA